ncbi:hypothetical protein ACLOJK_037113, partial [Asimina triloba]
LLLPLPLLLPPSWFRGLTHPSALLLRHISPSPQSAADVEHRQQQSSQQSIVTVSISSSPTRLLFFSGTSHRLHIPQQTQSIGSSRASSSSPSRLQSISSSASPSRRRRPICSSHFGFSQLVIWGF